MTTSTPIFDVKSNTWPSEVSRTSIVTVNVPSLKVPSLTGSTFSSVVPSGQVAFPGTVVGTTAAALVEPAKSTATAESTITKVKIILDQTLNFIILTSYRRDADIGVAV